jgi:membrane protease YdiL (CAAX protease family)
MLKLMIIGNKEDGGLTTQDENIQRITTKELIPSFWLSQLLLLVLGIGFVWLFYLRRGDTLTLFFSVDNLSGIGLGGTLAALLGIALQWGAWKRFSLRAFDDGGINRLLLTLPMVTLVPMFALGAFSEELLVRGVLQTGAVAYFGSLGGVLVTSLIFTGIHFRYLKKPVLIGGVFLLSLILGSLYVVTESLWASIGAHFMYNSGAAYLAKKFYLPLIQEGSSDNSR